MAITRTAPETSSGWISGTGFAIAKTMESLFIDFTSLSDTTPGPESPMKMSAPASASPALPFTLRGFVCSANHCFIEFMFSVRPR